MQRKTDPSESERRKNEAELQQVIFIFLCYKGLQSDTKWFLKLSLTIIACGLGEDIYKKIRQTNPNTLNNYLSDLWQKVPSIKDLKLNSTSEYRNHHRLT